MSIGHGEKRDAHLKFIRRCPCCICGSEPSEAAHVRFSDAETGKISAVGQKPGDEWTVPLCARCHREGPQAQHKSGEYGWWMAHRIDPLDLARQLFAVSPDIERGESIARQARRLAQIVWVRTHTN